MQAETAVSLINDLKVRPGYQIYSSVHDNFEDTITLDVEYQTFNANRYQEQYNQPALARAAFNIQVGLMLEVTDLYRAVLDRMLEIESHEWREFLRDGRTDWAPFHPHRTDGMARFGQPERDLVFGLARP